jgi:hypothetical protein
MTMFNNIYIIVLLIIIVLILLFVFRIRKPRRRAVTGKFIWDVMTTKENAMSKIIHLGNTSTASVTYQDKEGDNVPVVGVPVWSVAPDGVVTVAAAADGLSAVVTPVAIGNATITVVAEGDETPGVDTITLTGDVSVAAEEASGGKLVFS